MKEFEQKDYVAGDVKRIQLFEEMTVSCLERWDMMFDIYAKNGPAATFYDDGQPVMCCGILLCYPGMGEAWLVADQAIRQYPFAAFRQVQKVLEEQIEILNLHRVQANTISSWRGAVHFLEKLGFEREGTMRKAGPAGEDRDLFARVK